VLYQEDVEFSYEMAHLLVKGLTHYQSSSPLYAVASRQGHLSQATSQ